MSSPAQTNTQKDEQAIRTLIDTWLQASERGDLPTILNLMESDIVFMTPGREPFGKDAFVKGFEEMNNVKLKADSDIQEIRVAGEWAWVHNYLKVTMTPERGEPTNRAGHILSVLRKGSDGQWRIARDANLLMPQ